MLKKKSFYIYLLILAVSTLAPCSEAGIMNWIFGSQSDSNPQGNVQESTDQAASAELVSKSKAKFEMKTADDNFLALSQFTKDLSPLDICHHSVIAELTSTCSDLSEEELGKLSVQLLNCQSQAEGRTVYPCTPQMTIAECTGAMDAVTWNAYQIVSNRARAVCYSARQQQFRMKTEHTVNTLVHTTQGQLEALSQIQEDHDSLKAATRTTLDQVHASQKDLSSHQRQMATANKNVNAFIVGNIRELTREKALIASGNKELAEMADRIKAKLEEATEKILDQGDSQKSNHEEILADLAAIRERAREVWQKIDNSSKDMLHYRDETKEHYQHTLENLERVNQTIAYLEATLHNTKAELESKLDWLMGLVGGTGDKVALLSTLFLHGVYLVLGALSAAFLQTPRFSRLLLLALVPLNAWSHVQTRVSLGFLPMTMFIILTVTANWLMSWTWYLFTKNRGKGRHVKGRSSSPASQQCAPLNDVRSPEHSFVKGGRRDSQGLSSPDIHRLVHILENIYNSGILKGTPKTLGVFGSDTPGEESMALTHLQTPLNPPPTPNTCSMARRTNDMSLVRRQLLDRLDPDAPTSSTPLKGGSPVLSHCSTPIRLAGSVATTPVRGLASTPAPQQVTPERGEPREDVSALDTPRKPRTPRTPKVATPRSQRPSTPNRSVTRPLCLATTKSGMPCKLQSMDGSAFCHRHQVAK